MSTSAISHQNKLLDGLLGGELRAMNVQETVALAGPTGATHCSAANSAATGELSLISQAKSGCPSAFGELYKRHRLKIYRTVRRVLGNRQDAEDAVQRSFERAFINFGRFRGDASFTTWLTRIAINEALMLLRQRRATTPLSDGEGVPTPSAPEPTDERPSPEQLFMSNELRTTLHQAIANLRENLLVVILLKELQGLTSAETARRLGLTVSAVKARVFHARRCLRKYLERVYRRSSGAGQRSARRASLAKPAFLPKLRKPIADADSRTDDVGLSAFLTARARLFGIAYRILKSAAEAEDLLQEVWIRWQITDRSAVRDAAAFLSTMTRRLAINVIQSARLSRESSNESSLRETEDAGSDPQLEAERSEGLRRAVLVLFEKLSPAERAAYVLREAFDYSYREIANLLRLREVYARQLVTRARQHLAESRHASANSTEQRRFLAAFVAAAQKGALANLESLMAASAGGTVRKGERAVPSRIEPIRVPRRHRWTLLPQLDAKVA